MATPKPQLPPPFPTNQPLPQNPFHPENDVALHDAYQRCFDNEKEATLAGTTPLIHARCLGYLLLELPNEGRRVLAHEILECVTQKSDNLDILGKLYVDYLIRLFRQNKGKTPTPSYHPSRPSFEMHRAFFGAAITSPPRDHTSAKKAALYRDNYRCMVTGRLDSAVYNRMSVAQRQQHGVLNYPTAKTNFCHIFPPSTNRNLNADLPGHPKTVYSGNVWGIINSFNSIDVLAELDGNKLHSLSNGLTLRLEVHSLFDDLDLWFEEVQGVPNTYTVCTLDPNYDILASLPYPRQVTFTTTTGLELPDPRYLKLHAVVCRVAHLSGAADYLELCDREYEECPHVMAYDGSSAMVLESRLLMMSLKA